MTTMAAVAPQPPPRTTTSKPNTKPSQPPPPRPSAPPPKNGRHHTLPTRTTTAPSTNQKKKNLTSAKELIRSLDIAFADMTSSAASASEDAEDARRNARAASEVARRYTGRSYTGDVTSRYRSSPGSGKGGATPWKEVERMNGHSTQMERSLPQDYPQPEPQSSPFLSPKARSPTTRYGSPRKNNTNRYVSPPKNTPATPLSPASAARKRKILKESTESTNAAAASYAEDILSLSLELERTKQALYEERSSHAKTQSKLEQEKSRSQNLEAQVQKLLETQESTRESHGRETDRLRAELSRANARVGAAEEDAQLALDLAKESSQQREEAEEMLSRAIADIENLRRGDAVENYNPPSPMETPKACKNHAMVSKAMVSAGRELLKKAAYAAPTMSESGAPTYQVRLLTRMSAEKRQKLHDRLRSLDEETEAIMPLGSRAIVPRRGRQLQTFSRRTGTDLGFSSKSQATNQAVGRMLRESGVKLGLGGRWWSSSAKVMGMKDDDLECMTRSYCKSVEVKIGRQKEDMKELEAFCSYLERKVVASSLSEIPASSVPEPPSSSSTKE